MEVDTSPSETQESPNTMFFCRMCQAVYRQPKVLPCLHSFCRPCLVDAVTHRQQEGTFIVCPLCSHQANLPPSGVVGVPDNVFLNRMCQEYLNEVQTNLVAKSLHASGGSASETAGGARTTGQFTRYKFPSSRGEAERRSSQEDTAGSGPGSPSSVKRGPVSVQSPETTLEAIRNTNRLQAKILSLQGDALRVTYAIDQVNQSMVEWHQHKEDLKRSIQRRSSQFQFFIKRMEHLLLNKIDSKQSDDDFYGESDLSKTKLREVLRNILQEVNVLKSVQEFGKDTEINSMRGTLLGKSVGMSEVKLKKFQFSIDTAAKSIEDIVAENFGQINLTSEETSVFSPETTDFTDYAVGNVAETAGTGEISFEQPRERASTTAFDEEEYEKAISRATSKRSSERRSRRHNTDLGLDKADVKEYLAQFQTARETFRTRRREILAQSHRVREDASPLRDEVSRRSRSSSTRGRVQSLDRRPMPLTISAGKSILSSKPDITQITTTANQQPDIMPQTPPEGNGSHLADHTIKFQYGGTGGLTMPGVIPEDITLPSPVIEESAVPTSPQKRLVKQASDPRSTYEKPLSPDEPPGSNISPPSHTMSLMEQLKSRRFSNPVVSGALGLRRYSDQPTKFFPSDHPMNLDLQGQDRISSRPLRRVISGATDKKSKMEFLRETWQRRKEILMQNEGFIPPESHQAKPAVGKTPPESPSQTSSPPATQVTTKETVSPHTAGPAPSGPASPPVASPAEPNRAQQIQSRLTSYRSDRATVPEKNATKQEPVTTQVRADTFRPLQPPSEADRMSSAPTRLATIQAPTPVATTTLVSTSPVTRPFASSSRLLKETVPATTSPIVSREVAAPARTPTTTITTAATSTAATTRETYQSKYSTKPGEQFDVASLIAAMYSGKEKTIIHTNAQSPVTPTTPSQNGITTTTSRPATTTSYTRSFLSSRTSTATSTAATETPKPADPLPFSHSAQTSSTVSTTQPSYQYDTRRYRYGLASRESSQGTTSDTFITSQTRETPKPAPAPTTEPAGQTETRRYRYGMTSSEGVNRRHTIEIGRDDIRSALQAESNKPSTVLATIPDSPVVQQTPASILPQTRLLDRLRYGYQAVPKPEPSPTTTTSSSSSSFSSSAFTSVPSRSPTVPIQDTTISHHITAKGVTTKTIPYPLVLEPVPDETSLEPPAVNPSGRPVSPSPTSPTPAEVAAKGRLREMARKKRERWRHLTIH